MSDETTPRATLPALWREIAAYKSASALLSPGLHWFGVPRRASARRLEQLTSDGSAERLLAKLRTSSDADLTQCETLARINAEQAETAFRRAFVINVSTPFALFLAWGQLAPDSFAEVMTQLQAENATAAFIIVLALLILGTIAYAYARAADARDLRDLIEIERARR